LKHEPVETTLYSLAASAPRQPERRSSERFLSLLRVGAIVVEGRRELCLIRNISAGGMMIRTWSTIAPGTRLSVELKHGHPVTGVVQWTESDLTGVTFDTAIDVVDLLATSDEGPRPRLPRIDVDAPVSVREDRELIRGRAVNISQGGICIECDTELTLGGDVVVILPGLAPTAGVVKWRSANSYGIGFNRTLTLPEIVRWLQEQQLDEQRRAVAAG
jgi:hypothetical protein